MFIWNISNTRKHITKRLVKPEILLNSKTDSNTWTGLGQHLDLDLDRFDSGLSVALLLAWNSNLVYLLESNFDIRSVPY